MNALEVSGVKKRYVDGARRLDAVAGVDLEIPAGQLWVLRGPSGSGKTTLLGILGGMVAPTAGRVTILGDEVSHLRDHHRTKLRRERIGFVFQELQLIDGMSVLENVTLALVPSGGARPADVARARSLLERFGLNKEIEARTERLSGGQRQRAAVARALMLRPKILLLDEPTAHLDTDNAMGVVDLLAELAAEGTTIVAATHDPRLADDPRVDRVVTMRDGAVVGADSKQPRAHDSAEDDSAEE